MQVRWSSGMPLAYTQSSHEMFLADVLKDNVLCKKVSVVLLAALCDETAAEGAPTIIARGEVHKNLVRGGGGEG